MKKIVIASSLFLIFALTIFTIPKEVTAGTTGDILVINLDGQQTILTNEQITALPNTNVEAVLSCYGSFVASGQWTGVKLSDLLTFIGSDSLGGSIEFAAQDAYKRSIPMQIAMQPDVILAYAFDSSPLQETYRLVVPEANGEVWVAWVVSITVSESSGTSVVGKSANVFDVATDISQNAAKNTPSPTRAPISTPKPITATPSPSIPASVTPSITPTNTTSLPTSQPIIQSAFTLEPVYVGVACIIGVLIVVSLMTVKKKRSKTAL